MFYYVIDEMYSLICNYGQWTSKFGENILIQKSGCNYVVLV